MVPGVFITGTNTGVGKTAIAAALLRLLAMSFGKKVFFPKRNLKLEKQKFWE